MALLLFFVNGLSIVAADERKASAFVCNGGGPFGTIYFLRDNSHQAHYCWNGLDRNSITNLTVYLKVKPVTGFGGAPTGAQVKVAIADNTGAVRYQLYNFTYDTYLAIPLANINNLINTNGQLNVYLQWNGKEHIGVEADGAYLAVSGAPPVDTDGDGLPDISERAGWDVVIYRIRTGEVVQTIHVTSDPLKKDTDGDGLADNLEYGKSNPRSADTDNDGLMDNSDDIINGIENQAPDITSFSYSAKLSLGKYKINVKLQAADQGSRSNIASIRVKVASTFDSSNRSENDGDYNQTHNIYWFSGAVVSGFDIEAWITDRNGNVRYLKRHLQSMVEWVKGGVEKAWDYAANNSIYYEIKPFPRLWQGPYGLCAACSVLEIAHYYFKVNENFNTVKAKSGSANILDGMNQDEERQYLQNIGVYESEALSPAIPAFDSIKQQIIQKDPVFGAFIDYYGADGDHAVVIVGFLDGPGDNDYLLIQDSNIVITSYLMPWSYLRNHFKHMFFTNGTGMAG
jgi:hypothetical protein